MSNIAEKMKDYPWLCSGSNELDFCDNEGSTFVKDSESDLDDEATDEAYGTYGLKFTYYKVSEDLVRDKLFGGDEVQMIERAFYFKGYTDSIPPNVRTYHLEGIMGEDLLTVYVGSGSFRYFSTYGGSDRNTPEVYDKFEPRIGDIVYLEPNDTFYAIRDVKYFNEAFGLRSHTYTLTLKVYEDYKYTIDKDNPTLSDSSDPIYKVAPHELPEQNPIKDPLALNDKYEVEELRKSENVNTMDVLYDTEENEEKSIDPFNGW